MGIVINRLYNSAIRYYTVIHKGYKMNTEQEKKFHDWYYSEKRLHGYCYSGMVWEACLNSVAEDKLLRELNMRDFKVFHEERSRFSVPVMLKNNEINMFRFESYAEMQAFLQGFELYRDSERNPDLNFRCHISPEMENQWYPKPEEDVLVRCFVADKKSYAKKMKVSHIDGGMIYVYATDMQFGMRFLSISPEYIKPYNKDQEGKKWKEI